MTANRLIVEKERVETVRIDKSDLAIGVAIAVILFGVLAASFTETYLLGTHTAVAAQDQGHSVDLTVLAAGKGLFAANCASCHHTDKNEEKGGPSFKGLSQTRKLPTTGREATEQNIDAQLKFPAKNMPKFDRLSEQDIISLVAYLLSL